MKHKGRIAVLAVDGHVALRLDSGPPLALTPKAARRMCVLLLEAAEAAATQRRAPVPATPGVVH